MNGIDNNSGSTGQNIANSREHRTEFIDATGQKTRYSVKNIAKCITQNRKNSSERSRFGYSISSPGNKSGKLAYDASNITAGRRYNAKEFTNSRRNASDNGTDRLENRKYSGKYILNHRSSSGSKRLEIVH